MVSARGLGLALCALVVTTAVADASPYPATSRPLTRPELVSTTVHEAAWILVGDFVSQRLTDVDPASGLNGYLPYHVGFRPRRWLKGDEQAGELEICWWPRAEDSPQPGLRIGGGPLPPPLAGQTFIVFARRPDDRSPAADSCTWFGIPGDEPWLLPALSPWSQGLEDEVRQAIGRQVPELLALRSDRVVLGVVEREPGKAGAPGVPATFVRVMRTLKGPRAPARLPLRLVDDRALAVNDPRPRLFFLRRAGDGVFEPVELIAGVLAVRGGRVPDWDLSLEEAVRKIRRAR